MFSFLGDLTGEGRKPEDQKEQGADGQSDAGAGLGLGSLWNVATAVTSAVKQTADEVVKSVQQTDWKSELATFTHEVEAEAHKAVEVVQHLPQQIAQPPRKADGTHSPRRVPASSSKRSSSGTSAPAAPLVAVGSSIAEFGKQLISGTKEVLDTVTEMVEGEMATAAKEVPRFASGSSSSSRSAGSHTAAARLASRRGTAARYSRFDSEVAAMQRDSSTYCDEPEDLQDYSSWRSATFTMQKMQPEIDKLLTGNAFMAELQSRIVPLLVEQEDFWARYFYRLHKLQQKEEQRQQLAARVKQQQEQQEDLGGWDWDDPQSPRHRQQQQPADGAEVPTQQQQQSTVGSDMQSETCQHRQEEAMIDQSAVSEIAGVSSGSSSQDTSTTAPPAAAAAASETPSSTSVAEVPIQSQHAAVSGAAATATAAVPHTVPDIRGRKSVSTDESTPSTPVKIGSDVSDAAPATETTSDSSAATSRGNTSSSSTRPKGSNSGGGATTHWTLVGSAAAAAVGAEPADQQQQQQGQQEGRERENDQPVQIVQTTDSEIIQVGSSGSSSSTATAGQQPAASSEPETQAVSPLAAVQPAASASAAVAPAPAAMAALTTASAKPAAAAAAAAASDDEDWGDDADEVAPTAAAAAGLKGSVKAGAAGVGDEDDDWGNWE